jgi:hypothetical protein
MKNSKHKQIKGRSRIAISAILNKSAGPMRHKLERREQDYKNSWEKDVAEDFPDGYEEPPENIDE